MPGIDFAEARTKIALAEVLDLLGFVPWGSATRPVSGGSFDLTSEPQLFRESETTHLQMFQMRIMRESTRSLRFGDWAEPLRGHHRSLRAAPP